MDIAIIIASIIIGIFFWILFISKNSIRYKNITEIPEEKKLPLSPRLFKLKTRLGLTSPSDVVTISCSEVAS